MIAPCDTCDSTGYLLGQTYGQTEPPAGAVTVQRCDDCCRFTGDAAAASAAAAAFGTSWGYPPHPDSPALIADGEDCWVVLPTTPQVVRI